ncbi:MAG: hypothetical protein H6673_02510 [Anaerolineales bacterium]|nr:hypothetical protein [Anaerolineales bacterium]
MPAKFARYIFHVLPVLVGKASHHPDLDRVLLWDDSIAALEQRRLPMLMLGSDWREVDSYLRLRPEQFDTLAHLLNQRQAWIGSWYWTPHSSDTVEQLVRNLLLGRRSAGVFGVVEEVGLAGLPEHDVVLPALAAGFGFRYVYRLGGGVSMQVVGVDGFPMNCMEMVADPVRWRATEAGDSQHMAVAVYGRPFAIIEQIQQWRATLPHDDFLITNPTTLGAIQPSQIVTPHQPAVWGVYWGVEAAYAQMVTEGQTPTVPFLALQQAYHDVEMRAALETILQTEQASLIETTHSFHITAIKPREDGAVGVIVRGVNLSDERIEVTLRLWRRFEHCAVVRLDERPTGGTLPIETDGTIQFMAAPSRLLTLWLY